MVKKTDSLMKEIEAMFPRLAVLDMMDDADNIREYIDVSLIKSSTLRLLMSYIYIYIWSTYS